MGARRVGALGAAALALAAVACHTPPVAKGPERAQDLSARLDAVVTAGPADAPGCAVGVVREGALVYAKAFGAADLQPAAPITAQTRFLLASVSKQFTAFAVLLLWREGKLSLDDDVRTYVPELPDYGRPIRIRHLLRHGGGLRDAGNLLGLAGREEGSGVTLAEYLAAAFRQRAPSFPAGEQYGYSNTGYVLLGLVVARVSGTSLRDFAARRIFGPLGMTRTHVHDARDEVIPDRAHGHARDPSGAWERADPYTDVVGASGVYSTLEDMARWDANFDAPKVGDADLLEEMTAGGRLDDGTPIPYGGGLRLHPYRGLRAVSHGGAQLGFRAHYLRFPDARTSVVCLCNASTFEPRVLAQRVADALFPDAPGEPMDRRDPPPATPSALPTWLPGAYLAPRTTEVRFIAEDGGALSWQNERGEERVIARRADGTLWLRGHRADVTLTLGGSPEAAWFEERADGLPPVRFERQATPAASVDLTPYAGDYQSDEVGMRVAARVVDGRLTLSARGLTFPVRAIGPHLFFAPGAGPFRFHVGPGGRGAASALEIVDFEARGVLASRVE